MKTPIKSSIATLTLVAFVMTQVVTPAPAYAAAAHYFPTEVSALPTFEISVPSTLGTVETLIQGTENTLVHIQTAHGNYEAQKSIQGILKHLRDNYGFNKILLEGSAHKLEPELLRLFPKDMRLTKKILDRLMRQAYVKGSEMFLLEEAGKAEGYGI